MESGINDESALISYKDAYMANDHQICFRRFRLYDWRFKRTGTDKRLYIRGKDDLVNIVGNVVGEVDVKERENKDGEALQQISLLCPKMMREIYIIMSYFLWRKEWYSKGL